MIRTSLQHVVRAGMWLFSRIAEPRVPRLIQFGIYLCLGWAGHLVLLNPPASFTAELGGYVIVFAWFLTLGAAAGAVAVLPGTWWLERMAVISIWVALGLFTLIAIGIGNSPIGAAIAIALAGALIQRWREIRQYHVAPRR